MQRKEAKELAVILGEQPLSSIDKLYANFADALKRSMYPKVLMKTEPLKNIGNRLGSSFNTSRSELKRIRDEFLDKYLPKKND